MQCPVDGVIRLFGNQGELMLSHDQGGLGFALLAASYLLLPGLAEGAADAWRWLGRREAFQGGVAESHPLFLDRGRLNAGAAIERLGYFVFVFPAALVLLALRAWRDGRASQGQLSLAGPWLCLNNTARRCQEPVHLWHLAVPVAR